MLEKMKMIWQDAKQLKDERGLTLVELLVVVVILGIIAAIAVVAIGGIIENSRKDAMVSDAKQMVNAAKLYVASNPVTSDTTLRFKEATAEGATATGTDASSYIDAMKDPYSDGEYKNALVKVTVGSDDSYSYSVFLNGEKSIGTSAAYESEKTINKDAVE
ncbi:prepilin-type N-terminal cleavage/methylation domain-containing protein [Exiguobacterium sp. s146]|uniref:prepilin-type N-terminal cleavage/methylation domain-containing protein n=1 Tax=Exiguobacterium sp. s146 TaxID=2751223 RepID=UPI001BEAB436|nr:prepilin-type N-terminal cleavage/methylation domain-containing protein [Exiguobacterium sp. s146]